MNAEVFGGHIMLRALTKIAKTPAGANWGSRIANALLVLVLCVGITSAAFGSANPKLEGWQATGIFVGGIAVSVLLAQMFFDLDGWFEQRGRDLQAQKVYDGLLETADHQSTRSEGFILYLRPFASTDKIGVNVSNVVTIRSNITVGPQYVAAADRVEFEEDIERALRPLGPLVALGKPLEHMGAGRIRVEDDVWQDAIKLLIDRAKLIVLLPSPRPGTCWEVEHLLSSGAVRKTMVVDPPNEAGADTTEYDPELEWVGVKSTFLDYGYVLPEDCPDGQLLFFSAGTRPVAQSNIGLGGKNKVRSFAKKMMREIDRETTEAA
jgi:hypothetical protein